MFFKKFFDKSPKYYSEKGDKYLAEGRYADARHSYMEALQKLGACEDPAGTEVLVRKGLAEAGNRLALLNIEEAQFALNRGEVGKAAEYLKLAQELSEDGAIAERAACLEQELEHSTVQAPAPKAAHSCGGCGTGTHSAPADHDPAEGQLVADDRFAFLIQTLPESLAKRYAAMGDEFAAAYLTAHEGDEQHGLDLYQEMLRNRESDILLYESAIIQFRNGAFAECEKKLRRAIELNPNNELCFLGLVQLLVETGRAAESVALLHHMIAEQMLAGQAVVVLGDVYLALGEEEKAMETLLPALQNPVSAKAAAERLVPLLEGQGRRQEAAYLLKTHLKGCC